MMPVSCTFEDGVLVVECKGDYGPAELRSSWDQATRDPICPPEVECCLDVRFSTSLVRRTIADLRGITDWFANQASRVNQRCAIVTRPGLQYGLMRMAGAWADHKGIEVRVFLGRAEAVRWLVARHAGGRNSEDRPANLW